jgi:hypothetical protein
MRFSICYLSVLDSAVEGRLSRVDAAVVASKEVILSCIPNNTSLPKDDERSSTTTTTTSLIKTIMRTRTLSQRLTALDFCECIPDVIWCGHMEFQDPMLPDWSAQHARVLLRSIGDDENNSSWSLRSLHGWRSAFPISAIKLVSQTYNFIPIRPRGRLCGLTEQDRATIRAIRRRLESRDQVMTLRYPHYDGFILRIISPEQAKLRLASFSNSTSNRRNQDAAAASGFESFSEGLLCCWEYPSDDDDSPVTKEDQFESVFSTLRSYKQTAM